MPNHPANSFYYPRLEELPPIASIKITRQSRSPDRQAPMSNHILPNSISPQRFSGEAKGSVAPKHFTCKITLICITWKLWYGSISRSLAYLQMLQAHANRNHPCFCWDFDSQTLPFFSFPSSDTTGLWSVSLVILGLVSGSLLQRGCPPPHTLHPLAASQCWHPLPWAGGTGWMCTTQLYEASVTRRAHKHRYCQYSTLGLSCYYCWTKRCFCILSISLIMQRICVFDTVKLWIFKTWCIAWATC